MAGKAGKPVPAFLGYIVPQEVTLMADKLMQQSWLPVVLDLDETLLVANSAHQLLAQIHKATISRSDSCLVHPRWFTLESMLVVQNYLTSLLVSISCAHVFVGLPGI